MEWKYSDELIVKDPKQTTSSWNFNSINLVGVKLDMLILILIIRMIVIGRCKENYFKNKTQITSSGSLGSLTTITDGIHNINKLNDHGAITDTILLLSIIII